MELGRFKNKLNMSKFELNKLFASILLASLIIMLTSFLVNLIYKPTLTLKKRGWQIEVATTHSKQKSQTIQEIDLTELMKTANAKAGKKIIKKCISCHSFEKGGANKIGPNLWNVFMSKKGMHPANYPFSKAMKAKGGAWDEQSLFAFLAKPSKYVPGTKMSFIGIKDPKKRADVIAFLKKNKD